MTNFESEGSITDDWYDCLEVEEDFYSESVEDVENYDESVEAYIESMLADNSYTPAW